MASSIKPNPAAGRPDRAYAPAWTERSSGQNTGGVFRPWYSSSPRRSSSKPSSNLLLEQSLPVLRALNDRWGCAVALYYLGRVACDQADWSTAGSAWTESLDTCRAQGYLWCVPYLLEGFACLAGLQERAAPGAPCRALSA